MNNDSKSKFWSWSLVAIILVALLLYIGWSMSLDIYNEKVYHGKGSTQFVTDFFYKKSLISAIISAILINRGIIGQRISFSVAVINALITLAFFMVIAQFASPDGITLQDLTRQYYLDNLPFLCDFILLLILILHAITKPENKVISSSESV